MLVRLYALIVPSEFRYLLIFVSPVVLGSRAGRRFPPIAEQTVLFASDPRSGTLAAMNEPIARLLIVDYRRPADRMKAHRYIYHLEAIARFSRAFSAPNRCERHRPTHSAHTGPSLDSVLISL